MSDAELWTAGDAARILDPPMTSREVRLMVALFGVPVRGVLRTGYSAGKPPRVFSSLDILNAHAIVMNTRAHFQK